MNYAIPTEISLTNYDYHLIIKQLANEIIVTFSTKFFLASVSHIRKKRIKKDRKNSTNYFTMKISNKRELRQTEFDHTFDIGLD